MRDEYDDTTAREFKPRESGRPPNRQARITSAEKQSESPVFSRASTHPTQATKVVSLPPIVNWIASRPLKPRGGSTSGPHVPAPSGSRDGGRTVGQIIGSSVESIIGSSPVAGGYSSGVEQDDGGQSLRGVGKPESERTLPLRSRSITRRVRRVYGGGIASQASSSSESLDQQTVREIEGSHAPKIPNIPPPEVGRRVSSTSSSRPSSEHLSTNENLSVDHIVSPGTVSSNVDDSVVYWNEKNKDRLLENNIFSSGSGSEGRKDSQVKEKETRKDRKEGLLDDDDDNDAALSGAVSGSKDNPTRQGDEDKEGRNDSSHEQQGAGVETSALAENTGSNDTNNSISITSKTTTIIPGDIATPLQLSDRSLQPEEISTEFPSHTKSTSGESSAEEGLDSGQMKERKQKGRKAEKQPGHREENWLMKADAAMSQDIAGGSTSRSVLKTDLQRRESRKRKKDRPSNYNKTLAPQRVHNSKESSRRVGRSTGYSLGAGGRAGETSGDDDTALRYQKNQSTDRGRLASQSSARRPKYLSRVEPTPPKKETGSTGFGRPSTNEAPHQEVPRAREGRSEPRKSAGVENSVANTGSFWNGTELSSGTPQRTGGGTSSGEELRSGRRQNRDGGGKNLTRRPSSRRPRALSNPEDPKLIRANRRPKNSVSAGEMHQVSHTAIENLSRDNGGTAMGQIVSSADETGAMTRTPHPESLVTRKGPSSGYGIFKGLIKGALASAKGKDTLNLTDNVKRSPQPDRSLPSRAARSKMDPEQASPTLNPRAKGSLIPNDLYSSQGSAGRSKIIGSTAVPEATGEIQSRSGIKHNSQGEAPTKLQDFKAAEGNDNMTLGPKASESSASQQAESGQPGSSVAFISGAQTKGQTKVSVSGNLSLSVPPKAPRPQRQPPASTVRRRTISLPRATPIEPQKSGRRREYYLLDENPDNWLNPSMEIYEIADVVYGYLGEYISFMDLEGFYPPGTAYLHELSANAATLFKRVTSGVTEDGTGDFMAVDPIEYPVEDAVGDMAEGETGQPLEHATTALKTPNDIIDMVKVALYDVVIYCDDSGSMTYQERIPALKELVRRVTKITSTLDTNGINIRFINYADDDKFNNIHTLDEMEVVLETVPYTGPSTMIGSGLEKKILNPLLFDRLRAGTLKRPLLVTTITDGSPNCEDTSHFKNMILKCKETLKQEGFQHKSIVFQVSQVGFSEEAEEFIRILHNDTDIGHMVYCTSEKLDKIIPELQDDEEGLERWLLDLLLQGL